jgi:hypothetical protein
VILLGDCFIYYLLLALNSGSDKIWPSDSWWDVIVNEIDVLFPTEKDGYLKLYADAKENWYGFLVVVVVVVVAVAVVVVVVVVFSSLKIEFFLFNFDSTYFQGGP